MAHEPGSPVRTEYDRLAAEYDRRWSRYVDESLRLVETALPDQAPQFVLDCPCGTGELERRLLDRWPGLPITAIDLSPAMLKRATEKGLGDSVRWRHGDVTALPFERATFDLAICANALHAFPNPPAAIAELHRVLSPGGQLVLVDWCRDDWLTWLRGLWLERFDPATIHVFSVREAVALLEGSGFVLELATRARVAGTWGLMRLVSRRSDDGERHVSRGF